MLAPISVRVLAGAAVALLSTCSTPSGNTTPSPPAEPEAPTATAEVVDEGPTFDPDVVVPAPDSAIARVRGALDAGTPELGEQLATQALAHASEDELHALWWLSARASLDAGAPARAFATLENVSRADHPLAPWARLRRARILMEADGGRAAEEVAPLLELEWAGQAEARDLYAAALVSAGRAEEAEPMLRALLAEASEDAARAEIAVPLAELLAGRDADAKEEAIALLRRVATRAPLSSAGRAAETRATELIATLPRARRRRLAQPSAEDLFARAEALARAMRFAEAEEAFGEVVARTDDGALSCRARYGQGRAIYYRRQRRRAAEHLSEVARDCDAPEVRAWALYLAGKGFQSADEDDLALARYAELEAQVPEHSLADDARYRSALIEADRDHPEEMERRLRTLPDDYPQGDMRGRALFMLAWRARAAGERERAIEHLDALIAEGDGETDREDLGGRAAYWRACVLAELDREDDAIAGWTSVVRDHPLGYYAVQSLHRLEEADEAAATRSRALLGERGDPTIRFPWRDAFDGPELTRAVALLQVGEVDLARRELSALTDGAGDDELGWIEAALLDRAGAHPFSVQLTRRRLRDFMERPPAGAHYARWRIAYPRAYAPQIRAAVAERPIPAELVFAIAREESSFRADAVSVAHAYGLTQLILPTARRFGRRIDATVNARTLTDPAINVAIGAEYMSWLWERYADNPVVLPSAYNAGQGATDRWLRERSGQRLDEWIEDIPYDETRRYTRRVLQTWAIYAWLDRGELPTLRAQLPSR